jgi:coenzyme F420-0:L-glutamate ligase/coenzyme F420-1:gamma-L-glutamate ligase
VNRLEIIPVSGVGEVVAGTDLADLAATHADLLDGDVLVVSSKIVSKAEGRTMQAPDREAAIDAEAVRVVAYRRGTRIVETRHGLVLAAAGVDASNVAAGTVLLLPLDPDDSARRLRAGIRERTGRDVGVIVSDSLGRPWRQGVLDLAIGVAGLEPMHDLRGTTDDYGNPLEVTVVAVADEIAAAAELVKTKLAGVPLAIVRGLAGVGGPDGPGARALVRPAAEDMFELGTAEARRTAVTNRRTVRRFSPELVDRGAVDRALAAALTAPAPHHTRPFRFVCLWSPDSRAGFLDELRAAWVTDLTADQLTSDQIDRRVARGDVLRNAPLVIVPFLVTEGAHTYPDERRSAAERDMFVVAAGAAVGSLLIALSAEGLGSCWVSSTLFCPKLATSALGVPEHWQAMGAIGVGVPAEPAGPRPPLDPTDYVDHR